MIDIHSHVLPGIDDGSCSFEESIEILKKAYENGVTDLVATPHYIVGSDFTVNNAEKRKLLTKLKRLIKKENIDINIYLGNEVFVENNMSELKKTSKVATINNSKYLLFELPMNYKFNGLDDVIFGLRNKGFIPVIAHPERYAFLKENPSLIENLIDKGALFQSNIGSFIGSYGKKSKEVALLFLKHHAITFIGSDTHHTKNIFFDSIDEIKELMRKYISEEEIEDLFINNARKVLNKELIEVANYTHIKKGLFGKWK